MGSWPHGISLLVPTQNSERTVELCLRSFATFADEIICVDNGSNDNTISIVQDIKNDLPHLRFFNLPHLKDLYENRQYAFSHARYNWIVRIDSDYVAYTSGEYDIAKLRKFILSRRRTLWPITFSITHVTLFRDIYSTGIPREYRLHQNAGKHVMSPISTLQTRIIQRFKGMRFQRLGRWEGVRFQKFLRKIQIPKPHWFHCQWKSDMDLFYRSERTNWREYGDFTSYPTLQHWMNKIIKEKYGTFNIDRACEIYIKNDIEPFLMKYDEKKYFPYPEILRKIIENQNGNKHENQQFDSP